MIKPDTQQGTNAIGTKLVKIRFSNLDHVPCTGVKCFRKDVDFGRRKF